MNSTDNLMNIKIGDSPLKPISDWQLHLMKSDEAYGGSIKSSNIVKVDFPEEDGEVLYLPPEPKSEAFKYNVTFGFLSKGKGDSISAKVNGFWNSLKGEKIIIQNLLKGTQIECYAMKLKDNKFYPNSNVYLFDIEFYCPSGIIETI